MSYKIVRILKDENWKEVSYFYFLKCISYNSNVKFEDLKEVFDALKKSESDLKRVLNSRFIKLLK